VFLQWDVKKEDLKENGTVFVALRGHDADGVVAWTSAKTPIFVEGVIDATGDWEGDLTELKQMEESISGAVENAHRAVEEMMGVAGGVADATNAANAAASAALAAAEVAMNAEGPIGPRGEKGDRGEKGPKGDVNFIAFEIDSNFDLYAVYPEGYEGVTFELADDGCLEVVISE
jgi:hypothetical protein